MNKASQKELKELLIKKLSDKSTDLGEILTLSTELSKLDENLVRFTVDADHVSRLGLELVAKRETALSEIVKNAYDADAKQVDVHFVSENNINWLEIKDDGSGMSREELINGFMRISTSIKKENDYSLNYKRKRAGKKGIGRFATQRLGLKLTIITKRKSDNKALKVKIDWNQFQANLELISIANTIEEIDSNSFVNSEFNAGTLLIIEDLRENWTDTQIKRAYRFASDLLLPFPISKITNNKQEKNDSEIDPGFIASFKRIMDENEVIVADANNMYLEHALAEIEGWIDRNGQGHWQVKSNYYKYDSGVKNYITKTLTQYQNREEDNCQNFDANLIKNISFKAYYFNTGIPHIPKNLISIVGENLRNHGGMRLYRNGFRVLPYGEKFDDWLRLDFTSKNRVILPPMANLNLFGIVELTPNTIGDFEEVASREGLLETNAFDELQDFVSSTMISAIVDLSYRIGNTKVFAGEKDYVKQPRKTFQTSVEQLKGSLDELVNSPAINAPDEPPSFDFDEDKDTQDGSVPNSSESLIVTKKLVTEIEQQTQELISKAELYNVLAGLGLSMAEFTHEVKFNLFDVLENISKLSSLIKDDESLLALNKLSIATDNLKAYTSFFESSFQSLSNKDLELLDLRQLLNEFFDTIKGTKLDDGNIKIEFVRKGNEFFAKKAHRSNIDSLLVNLFSNAKKAIYKSGNIGRILIQLEELDDTIDLIFSDNGIGIPLENRDKIFEAFFTTGTQRANATEQSQMLGMGLGLTIVREIIEGLSGEIEVIEAVDGYSTSIRVSLPKADAKDINDEY